MHIFDDRFPPSPHWPRRPPHADVEAYRLLQRRIGTERAVIVTPSTYGTDNSCTLDALTALGPSARGIGVVDPSVSQAHLLELSERRVCGLRVNFVSLQSWGVTTVAMLETLAQKAAALSWHVQVFAHPEKLISMEGLLGSLPATLVIDHMGLVDPAERDASLGLDVLRRLVDRGRTWIKLSGAYMRSSEGAPGYGDTISLGQALVRHAPERMVWGSDWPHTTQPSGAVDDSDLIDLLSAWCADEATLKRVLVDNPAKLYGFES